MAAALAVVVVDVVVVDTGASSVGTGIATEYHMMIVLIMFILRGAAA